MAVNRLPFPICRLVLPWELSRSLPVGLTPKGNADTERVIRTLKEDLVWPYDWDHPFAFQRALDKWVDNYNQDFPHQSLGYHTPCEYYQNYGKIKRFILQKLKVFSVMKVFLFQSINKSVHSGKIVNFYRHDFNIERCIFSILPNVSLY